MNSPHDIGGMQRFGPVVREDHEPVFHAGWERSVFSIMLALAGQGRYNADHFRSARETIPPHRYLTSRYYELWLHAVEQLLADLVPAEEIAAKVEQLRADPAAGGVDRLDPELAESLHRGLREGHSTAGPAADARRFAVGDHVRTRNAHPDGHTRLPRYARDKSGVIESVYPAFPVPDRADAGDYTPEHLYCVRFSAEQLWGDDAEACCDIRLDMWESYLLPDVATNGPHAGREVAHVR